MADINFTSFPFAAASGSATRTMPSRLTDIVNVKDFGAIGDFSHDDTANIQAAFDFAFPQTTGGQLPAASTLNRMVFFPPGHYKITSALTLRGVFGGRIIGSGQNATIIENITLIETPGNALGAVEAADCINAQSYAFCTLEHMTLKAQVSTGNGAGPACFRMRSGTERAGPCQSNCFYSVTFDGGQIGLSLAEGRLFGTSDPYMCSETMIMGCKFKNQTAPDLSGISSLEYSGAGVATHGNNACDHTVLGSSFENCLVGMYIPAGSINLIEGCTFDNGTSNKFDIWVEGGARDSFCLRGCRSTSQNFIHTEKGCWSIIDCIHDCSVNGVFMFANGLAAVIRGCISTKGTYEHHFDQTALISCCTFGRSVSDWLIFPPATIHGWAYLEMENLTIGSTPTQIVRQRKQGVDPTTTLTQDYVVA